MAPPTPQPKPELTEEGWPLDELRAAIDEGIAQADRGQLRDADEVFDELLADLADVPDEE